MINKLRKKIFLIIQITLSIIILGIIILFAGFSYKNTITSSTMFMDRIEGREDIKNDKPKEPNSLRIDTDPFMINVDGVYKIEINNNSVIKESNNVTNEIKDYAFKLVSSNSEEGNKGK